MNLKSKTALAVLALISSGAFAQTAAAEPESTLGYNIGVVSNYSFRGITQTNYGGAVQGGADYAHKSGFYVGAWASNVSWVKQVNGASTGDYELDLYGGYKGELAPGLGFDVGYITYMYPGNDSGAAGTPGARNNTPYTNATTKEVYVGLTYGVTTFKVSQSLGDFLGNVDSNGSRYYDLSATFDLGDGYSFVPHIGRQTIPNQSAGTITGNAADYTDMSLTLGKDMGNGLVVSAAVVATTAYDRFYVNGNGDNKAIGKTAAVIGLKYSF
jgi:uncharacterized protein (TIGR02001 family)